MGYMYICRYRDMTIVHILCEKMINRARRGVMSKVNSSPLRILVVPPSERLPSFQIGIKLPFDELQARGEIEYKTLPEYDVTEQDLCEANVIVFLRNTTTESLRLLKAAQSEGIPVVYSIDDHFLHLPKRGFGITMAEPERRFTFTSFLKKADMIRVGSPYFAELIREEYNNNVCCIQASVDFSLIEPPVPKTRNSQGLIIGYEGSAKENDFTVIIPALQEVLRKYGKEIRLEFHGFVPAELLAHRRAVYFAGGREYKQYLPFLCGRAWDFGIAPLEDTLYNRCKSNNKFREYSACGIPGIYSRMPTYSDCVQHEITGLLVEHTSEAWVEAISRLIEDEPLRLRIREQATLFARSHYTVARCASEWRQMLLSLEGIR
ncbi:glycosyltransferase [Paenibacillaceae bacterium]|nr:glycosyltransferase [Paenibacillaceae bacterium]